MLLIPQSAIISTNALFPLPFFPMIAVNSELRWMSESNQEPDAPDSQHTLRESTYLAGYVATSRSLSGSDSRHTLSTGSEIIWRRPLNVRSAFIQENAPPTVS